MRSAAFTLLLLASSFTSFSQQAGFKKLDDVNSFRTAQAKANAAVNNITSDFKQVKNMSLLAEKIQSKGKFYFMKNDKLRIEYTEPYKYLVIMNGTRMLVKDEEKTNKINAGNSKMMQSVNRIMVDCMRGTVLSNPDFKVATYHNGKQYLLAMAPVSAEMRNLFDRIDVYIDKTTLNVDKLVMNEIGGDYTSMDFFNTRHNSSINETLFKVK